MEWMTMTEMVEAHQNAVRKEDTWFVIAWVQVAASMIMLAFAVFTDNDTISMIHAVGVAVNTIAYFAVTIRRERFWSHQVAHWVKKLEDGE